MKKVLTIFGLVGVGAIGRLVPHLPNATPITAITVAGAKLVGRAWAIIIPIAAMIISDALIGLYDWRILLSVYISFALIGSLTIVAKKYPNTLPLSLFILVAPLLFFLVTNFAVWLFSPWYEKSISGLLYCYELGLPFLRNMLLGDLVYVPLLLGASRLGQITKRLELLANKRFWVFWLPTVKTKRHS